jgi:hypothetical protein
VSGDRIPTSGSTKRYPVTDDLVWCGDCENYHLPNRHDRCDKSRWSPLGDEVWLGPCGNEATHDVLDTDGQWHPRCTRHVPAVVPSQADRVRVR